MRRAVAPSLPRGRPRAGRSGDLRRPWPATLIRCRTGENHRIAAATRPPSGARAIVGRRPIASASSPAASVAASWAIADATWKVDETRPSARSRTSRLADRHLGDVVDGDGRVADELLAITRQPIASSGSPRGSERDERVAEGGQEHRRDRHGPDAPAPRRSASATTAPTNEANPPTPATMPMTAGPMLSSSRTNSSQVAPKIPHNARQRHLGAGERPQDRVVADEPQAVADLGQDGLALLARGRRRLLGPDRAEQERRDQERDRVDGDRDRRGEDLDEEAADPERHELGRRAARGQRASSRRPAARARRSSAGRRCRRRRRTSSGSAPGLSR